MPYAVETRDLTRIFAGKRHWLRKPDPDEVERGVGPTTALGGVTMQIPEGELFGLLGPNGAGKTTLIKILCTLLLPTSGEAFVAGHDVTKDVFPIRQRIGMVSGGETTGYGLLTARENIWMFSQFYGVPSKVAKERIDGLMKVFGLWDRRDAKVRTLSTGQRQKMNMVRGFATDPDILFLDEPTLGLDVTAARIIRDYVMKWLKQTKRSARRGHAEPRYEPGVQVRFRPEVGAGPRRRLDPDGREGIRVREATVRRTDLRFRLGLNLRSIVGRAYPRVIGANREPSWLIFEVFLPLLGIAAYVFIYQAFYQAQAAAICPSPCTPTPAQLLALHQAGQNLNALVATVVLGGTMVAFWLNVLWSMASQLYWEKEIGNLQLYMMAPMNRMALLGGMAIGGMFMTSVRALSTLVAGIVVFGVIFSVANPFLLLAVFFVTLIALYGMGMMFASLYLLWGREAWNLSALMEEPIFFSSGFYFPVGGLFRVPGWGPIIAIIGSFVPATFGLDALRQLTLGSTAFGGQLWFFDVKTELYILVFMAVP